MKTTSQRFPKALSRWRMFRDGDCQGDGRFCGLFGCMETDTQKKATCIKMYTCLDGRHPAFILNKVRNFACLILEREKILRFSPIRPRASLLRHLPFSDSRSAWDSQPHPHPVLTELSLGLLPSPGALCAPTPHSGLHTAPCDDLGSVLSAQLDYVASECDVC